MTTFFTQKAKFYYCGIDHDRALQCASCFIFKQEKPKIFRQSSTKSREKTKMEIYTCRMGSTGGIKDKNYPVYVISVKQGGTNLGDIYIELFTDIAPEHAATSMN